MVKCPSPPESGGTILGTLRVVPQRVSTGIEPLLPTAVIGSVTHSLFSSFHVPHTLYFTPVSWNLLPNMKSVLQFLSQALLEGE